ncbi:MAG: UvrD-helicase domain-containing protein, partial [Candidatus Marinimicrobia bacterium]|nr:UvrD-helicase domain-containing protein [Candidatus Neomarinimicrobiota bacterium]
MAKADLSAIQREAVQCIDQPVLIFAGAGSGKTKVLTHKIAYLRNEVGIPDDNILAVTFTNKAAREMSQRVVKLIDATASDSRYKAGPIWSPMLHSNGAVQVGTFHSICARILRKEIHHLGYKNDFVIYDADDQLRLLKMVLEQNEYDLDLHPPQHYRSVISRAKNGMKGPVDLATKAKGEEADIFTKYQEALKNSHAVDFDDLLLLPLDLFNNHPKILNRYRKTFQYILVDEYQDTNRAQFEFVKLLAQKHRHICVVGDDDQSIYSWRGADITNILNFEKEFPDAEVFKLEQNYRSTAIILDAAHAVVERNQNRADKKLWTERKGGEAIQIYALENEREEAEQIFNLIQEEVLSNKRRFGDIVILYRTNAQSRAIEDILRRRTIAYKIIGGIKFYERKEVKDAMAYLRLLVNPSDPVSLERIINFPPRAIGETSMNRLRTFAHERKIDLFKSLGSGLEAGIQVKQAGAMKDFKAMIKRYQGLALNKDRGSPAGPVDEYSGMESSSSSHNFGVDEVVTAFLEEAGLIAHFRNQETTEAHDRLENIKELINSIEEFHIENPGSTIRDFLEDVALLSDVDRWADDTNAVTLMTLHSAKGLEFPVVFLTGL